MSEDPLDQVFTLEEGFYSQGYDLGTVDGLHAGFVEGKVFGIEKGYEKAVALSMLSGRAKIWKKRCSNPGSEASPASSAIHGMTEPGSQFNGLGLPLAKLPPLPNNSRLIKHINNLITGTDAGTLSRENSDEAVADFDSRMTKALAKAKTIANIIDEPLRAKNIHELAQAKANSTIEEAKDLSARH